jgi:hypothetical protein
MGADYCGTHWMQAAVIGRGGEAGERPAVKPEPWQTIAEALFRAWCRGLDVLPKFLQRRSFVGRQTREIGVDVRARLWFGCSRPS